MYIYRENIWARNSTKFSVAIFQSVQVQNRRNTFQNVMELTHVKSMTMSMSIACWGLNSMQNRTDRVRWKVQKMYYCSDGSCRKMYLHFMCSDGRSNAFEEDPAILTSKKGLYCTLWLLQNLLLVLVVQVVPREWEKQDIRCFTCLYNAITMEKYRHIFYALTGGPGWPWGPWGP